MIFLTIPVGNELRDWLLFSRPPAEVERIRLSRPAHDVSIFPLIWHGQHGITACEIKGDALREVRYLDLPHEFAAMALNRLCIVRDQTVLFYRYRKDKPPELVEQLSLPAKPVEFFNWRDQYLAARFADGRIQIIAVTELDRGGVVEDFQSPVAVTQMAGALFDLALLTANGVALCSPDVRGLQYTNPVSHVFHRTETPATLLGFVRGRLLVGEENGTLQELRRKDDALAVTRSIRLPGAPVAVMGTKFVLFIACRNGSLVVLDWRDDSGFVLKHRSDTGSPFAAFTMYGEQGVGLTGPQTLARYSPTPGGRLAIHTVGAILGLAGLGTAYWLLFVRRERTWWRLAVLVAVGAVYAHTLRRIVNPIEAAHFIEYGVLGIFAARALRHHLGDLGVYVAALLVCSLVGLSDEVVQWLHPERTGDLDDVWLNAKAGGLMLIAMAFGVPWRNQARAFGTRSQRVSAALLLANILGIALFMQFISRFGYAIEVPGKATFVSRLSPESVRTLDSERGAELGAKLQSVADRPYDAVLKRLRDETFLYELRVHLFRRDSHFSRASFFVAYKENQIIEAYYSNTVSHTASRWSDSRTQKCLNEIGGQENDLYRSAVAGEVITAFRPGQMWTVVAILGLGCLFLIVRQK